MSSIRTEAQDVLELAREEIAWVAVWKTGRSWNTECFWPDLDERPNALTFEEYDIPRLKDIVKADPMAVIVNGYYYNLGDASCMTRDSLADALRWHYRNGSYLVRDALLGNE